MTQAPFAKLTSQQVECLRLAGTGDTSKEIARKLGLTPAAIDDRFARAIIALGAANRREAVRWFADFEAKAARASTPDPTLDDTPDQIMPDALGIAPAISSNIVQPPFNQAEQRDRGEGRSVQEQRAPFVFDLPEPERRRWPLPFRRSDRNDLSIPARLALIPILAIAIIIAFGILLGGMDSLARVFADLHLH